VSAEHRPEKRPYDMAARLLDLLAARGESLAAAESLTGGLVASACTAAPGASRVFRGSITAYATDLKRQLLGVDGELLAERGAVDAEVARQMAAGVRRVLGADWGVATTGVAGPEAQDGRPVGTVFVAVAGPHGAASAQELSLGGDRAAIRTESVTRALRMVHDALPESGELPRNQRAKDTEQGGGQGCLQP
jgi:nicotinamide-nucleotide amidase